MRVPVRLAEIGQQGAELLSTLGVRAGGWANASILNHCGRPPRAARESHLETPADCWGSRELRRQKEACQDSASAGEPLVFMSVIAFSLCDAPVHRDQGKPCCKIPQNRQYLSDR